MSHKATPSKCPECGGKLKDNGGFRDMSHGALHAGGHGVTHGNPLLLLLAAGAVTARLLHPQTYTCLSCGHTFKH